MYIPIFTFIFPYFQILLLLKGFGISGTIDYMKSDYRFGFLMQVVPPPPAALAEAHQQMIQTQQQQQEPYI